MDAASITETLNIQINPVNDAPEPDGYKAPLPDGLENTTYTVMPVILPLTSLIL